MMFPIKKFSVSVINPQENADLVTFTKKFLSGKLHFLCSDTEGLWDFFHEK